jgi:hypothetical protein
VDMKRLNTEGVGCGVEELNPGPDGEVWKVVGCNAVDERDLGLDYEHTEDHVLITWVGLLAHAMIWGTLTFVVMYRKKGD